MIQIQKELILYQFILCVGRYPLDYSFAVREQNNEMWPTGK